MSRYAAFTLKRFHFWITIVRTVHSLLLLLQYILIPCIIQSFFIFPMSYIISYHIISYHIISYHIISYHIISYHIISCHIISYHIYFPSINPYRITKSIWIWKLSYLLGLRGDINTSVYNTHMVI